MRPSATCVARFLPVLLLAGCAGSGGRVEEAADPDEEVWIHLFDGETLDGWTAKFRGHEVGDNYANPFRVENGIIEVRYDGYDAFDEVSWTNATASSPAPARIRGTSG